MSQCDVAVVGAGFGGLACALELADRGAHVTLFEQLRYPGGCASTFTRAGHRFESGATLFSGFDDPMLFARWIREHHLDVRFVPLDPVIELRAPGLSLSVPPDRDRFVASLEALPDAPSARLRAFFDEQARVADALWSLFDDPSLLPPLGPSALVRHAMRIPRYAPLLRLVGRPLAAMLARHGLASFTPLRTWLDAVCQITVQCSVDEVEAPFALAAMDYAFRGTGHVHGGIGTLAWALARRVETLGGTLRLSDAVREISREGNVWRIESRKGTTRASHVVANLTPHALRRLTGERSRALEALTTDVETGWGAIMRYVVLDADALASRPSPFHLELVGDPNAPFVHGNHAFVSVGAASEQPARPDGRRVRTATISTHVSMATLRGAGDPGVFVDQIQRRLGETLAARAPEIEEATIGAMTGSPRTFERFTGRDFGYVGGIPRRAGLAAYRRLGPCEILPRLYLVGDSVFPGQSTLAVALGGSRVAHAIASARPVRALLPSPTRV